MRLIILFLLLSSAATAQRFPPIYGKIDYVDSLQSRKYKNNLAGDSVLSTDTSGKFKMKLASSGGSPNTSIGSAYKVAVNGTNNIKSLSFGWALIGDSATTGQVGIKVDSNAIKTMADGNYWRNVGNAGTSPGTNFLGTTDAVNLQLRTGGSKRFTINTSGAFGLGTGEDYGTSGYIMKSNGSGAAPAWINPSSIYPSLQQVTDVGNTTSNEIIIDDGSSVATIAANGINFQAYPSPTVNGTYSEGSIAYQDVVNGRTLTIAPVALVGTGSLTQQYPNKSGTFAMISDIPTAGANALGTYLVKTATNAPANAQIMGALATGIVKNTTTTGVQGIAVAGDFPTLNQNTNGSAASLTTPRTIGTVTGDATSSGSAFDGTANNTNALTFATVNSNVGTFGSATKASIITVNAKGLTTAASESTITPAIGSVTGLGTGIATALAVNTGSAGSFVVNGGALGTPSSGTATNLTGTAASLNIGGVAATATALANTRTIWGQNFNGTANITGTITVSTISNTGTIAIPTVTGTLAQFAETSTASSATPTPTGNARENWLYITAQAAAAAFAAPSGTPANGNQIVIRVKDNATSRALTWDGIYRASSDLALPSTTIISKTLYIGFVYNSTDSKWDLVSVLNNF